ncbi:MAG: DNA polymerase I [Muribaculaceae bacterium]|nr:DNA polymerase I [Muribaculaceae bacterium]
MPEQTKLFLLDAYALIYRAYYALMRTPRTTSYGLNTSAIFGFVNTLDEVLRKENPGYIAVCFDPPGGATFRHEKYAEYKAGRDKQPEDITLAIPFIKRILEAYRIPVVECPGYEADDVIGTLSRRAEAEGFTTYMMTPDKDYGQLVTDRVLMYRPALKGQGFEVRGPAEVCERHGISNPRQVIDLLALEGDASDNVPGCPGVGEKTAVKLIAEFGSVDNLLANTDKLKGALKTKIEENVEQIRMSEWLVTICTDVPLDIKPDDLLRREPDIDALAAIYKELEFKTFLARLKPEAPAAAPAPAAPAPGESLSLFDLAEEVRPEEPAAFTLEPVSVLTAPDSISRFLAEAASARTVGISVVADGSEPMTATVRGMAVAYIPDALPLADGEDAGPSPVTAYFALDSSTAPLLVEPLLANPAVTLVSDDLKRDMLLLRRIGAELDGARYFDTAVAHYLCNPETRHDTEELAMIYLGARMKLYGTAAAQRNAALTPDEAPAIAAERAAMVLRLRPLLLAELERKEQHKLLADIELPLIEVLADMEWEGARVDPAELHKLSGDLSERLKALETEAYDMAGRPFNVSSPSQVGQILFGEMQIDPKARKTKGGAWSTAEDVLEKYAADIPLVRLILQIRALRKLLATYVDALPKLINPRTGKLHTTYRQTVTATGRLSSTNPNLQNIPIRTDDGREIRRAFVADPGDMLLSADYSQIELRLMADLSGDPDMVEAFVEGQDIHRATAAKIYHIALDEVTDTQRRNAKTANFGIIYGISAFGLSERLGIPRSEAKALIEGYMATYPGVAGYMNESIERARRDGFVSTVFGRRRYLPDINSRSNTVRSYAERNAINAPLQGSAADIIKIAMIRIWREIGRRGLRSRMILQVHDELIFNVKPGEAAELQELVIREMEGAYSGRVPLEVSSGLADNWLAAH